MGVTSGVTNGQCFFNGSGRNVILCHISHKFEACCPVSSGFFALLPDSFLRLPRTVRGILGFSQVLWLDLFCLLRPPLFSILLHSMISLKSRWYATIFMLVASVMTQSSGSSLSLIIGKLIRRPVSASLTFSDSWFFREHWPSQYLG